MGYPGKVVYPKGYREFESRSLRQHNFLSVSTHLPEQVMRPRCIEWIKNTRFTSCVFAIIENNMDFKQSTFGEIIDSEKEMVLTADERYGAYYINASEFNVLLGEFIKSVDPDKFIFAIFLSQVKKHSTLALFSVVRLHHTQAMMDLRQVLEAGACASYAIANTDSTDFADVGENGVLDASQSLTNKRYKWLGEKYPAGSSAIRNMKESINSSAAHSNIIYAHNNFNLNDTTRKFETPFFDIEDEYLVKTNLWTVGNIIMGLVDLFYGVAKDHGGMVFADDFIKRLKTLEAENHRLKVEMMETDRYKKSLDKSSQSA